MKIIWLISYNFDGVMAGPSIRFQRYAPLFMEKGYRLQFIVNHENKKKPKTENFPHFDVHRIAVKPRFFSRTRFISQALLLILWKGGYGSHILSFGFQTYQIWMVCLLKFVFRCKIYYINTMAASSNFMHKPKLVAIVWNSMHRFLYRKLFNTLNGVICSTNELGQQLKQQGLLRKHPIVINNGVDISRFHPVSPELKSLTRNTLGLAVSANLFLFIGLKTERKGVRELCEAWCSVFEEDALSNHYLVLLGDEKPEANPPVFNEWWNEFKTSAKRFNILIFPGMEDVSPWYQAADIFVFPSKKEGMPNVLLEAMASGLPVVMNRFEGYSADYGTENVTHILFEHDEVNQRLKDTLYKIIRNDVDMHKIGRNGLEYAVKNFSLYNSIASYLNLFN